MRHLLGRDELVLWQKKAKCFFAIPSGLKISSWFPLQQQPLLLDKGEPDVILRSSKVWKYRRGRIGDFSSEDQLEVGSSPERNLFVVEIWEK